MRENRREFFFFGGAGGEVCLVGSEKDERKWWGLAVFSPGPKINLLKLGRTRKKMGSQRFG